MTNDTPHRTRLTHTRIFTVDALLSATLGILLVVAAEHIAVVSGGGLTVTSLRWVGGFLLPWAYYNWQIARQPTVQPHALAIHLVGDLGWIAGSLYLLVRDRAEFTGWGWVLYGPQTVTVLAIILAKVASSRASAPTRRAVHV